MIPERNVHEDNEESILYEIPHFKTRSGLKNYKLKQQQTSTVFPPLRATYIIHLLVPRLFSEVTRVCE